MNADTIQRLEIPLPLRPSLSYPHTHKPPEHLWSHAMSRRQFARAALGTLAVGAAFSTGFWKPGMALATQSSSSAPPVPIPGTSPALGSIYHIFGPGPTGIGIDPIDAEPITITNFNGFIGLAYISGTVTQTNTDSGESQTLPFISSDMRFMKGVYRGTDGRVHQGAFALV